jgi:hypothetical protein
MICRATENMCWTREGSRSDLINEESDEKLVKLKEFLFDFCFEGIDWT